MYSEEDNQSASDMSITLACLDTCIFHNVGLRVTSTISFMMVFALTKQSDQSGTVRYTGILVLSIF